MKKIFQNISKCGFTVINVFGALFSISAVLMYISNIFHIEISLPNIITKSLFLAIFMILLGKNRIAKKNRIFLYFLLVFGHYYTFKGFVN